MLDNLQGRFPDRLPKRRARIRVVEGCLERLECTVAIVVPTRSPGRKSS